MEGSFFHLQTQSSCLRLTRICSHPQRWLPNHAEPSALVAGFPRPPAGMNTTQRIAANIHDEHARDAEFGLDV